MAIIAGIGELNNNRDTRICSKCKCMTSVWHIFEVTTASKWILCDPCVERLREWMHTPPTERKVA